MDLVISLKAYIFIIKVHSMEMLKIERNMLQKINARQNRGRNDKSEYVKQ